MKFAIELAYGILIAIFTYKFLFFDSIYAYYTIAMLSLLTLHVFYISRKN
jgi:hypothetical protein